MSDILASRRKQVEDCNTAFHHIHSVVNDLERRHSHSFRGMSVWGLLAGGFFMTPIDHSGLTNDQLEALRDAAIPIQGVSKGSDIDAVIYVEENQIRTLAGELDGRIDVISTTRRFEHLTLVPYAGATNLYGWLQPIVEGGKIPHKSSIILECFFIVSQEAKEWREFADARLSKRGANTYRVNRGWQFFQEAYRGLHFDLDESLARVLEISDQAKTSLEKRLHEEAIKDLDYREIYLRKRNRFQRLDEILGN